MTKTAIQRSYVDKNGMVTFTCPKCGESRRESVERYKHQTGSIKIGCRCMNVYETQLNFRQSPRKETFLGGIYFRNSHPGDWGEMIIRDLSIGGCKFETVKACAMAPGEVIKLEFILDNPRSSILKKKAVVLNVSGCHVICKFSAAQGIIDSELGFYMKNR